MEYPNSTSIVNYCNLTEFSKSYKEVHGHLSILLCVFGSIANILNICVLTRRKMRWPTNLILTGLAVADLSLMLEYIPFASHVYLSPQLRVSSSFYSYAWAVFIIFHSTFTLTCHFISCCLTVILAIWRCIEISHPQTNKLWDSVCNKTKTMSAIFITYIFCPVVCLPVYLSMSIESVNNRKFYPNNTLINYKDEKNYNGTFYNTTIFFVVPGGVLKGASLMAYGVLIRLIPCILLTILSILLISALLETKSRRELLYSSGLPLAECDGKKGSLKQRHLQKEHQTDRTTRMLLAVLLLFLITEFPPALLGLIAFRDYSFFIHCYAQLGDVMDILALTNSAINFIIYCSMSQQFRSTFKEIFWSKLLNRRIPVAQQPPEVNSETTQVTPV